MGAAYSSLAVQRMAQTAVNGVTDPLRTPLYTTIKTENTTPDPKTTPPPPSAKIAYTLNPTQQHIAMQREAFEKERKILLRKASNFGGESAERVIGDYLAI